MKFRLPLSAGLRQDRLESQRLAGQESKMDRFGVTELLNGPVHLRAGGPVQTTALKWTDRSKMDRLTGPDDCSKMDRPL